MIAWLTHYDLVNGYGGAEGMDRDMISQAPEDVEVFNTVPENIRDYQHVVLTGALRLKGIEHMQGVEYVYWPHDAQDHDPRWYSDARAVVWTTPAHQQWGSNWTVKRSVLNPSWFDTNLFGPETKTHDLLWAARDVEHKGLAEARQWAEEQGATLTVLSGVPREEVAAAMSVHKRFILLSQQKVFDIAPRAVMEAQLSGCEIIVNDLVGYWNESPDVLRDRIDRAADEFWELVCK